MYRLKDVEFPVQVGLAAYLPEKRLPGGRQPDREGLHRWAAQRLPDAAGVLTEETARTEMRSKIKDLLVEASRGSIPAADYPDLDAKLADALSGADHAEQADAREIADWCSAELKLAIEPTAVRRPDPRSKPGTWC